MRREVFTKKKKKKADNKPGDDSIGTNPEIPATTSSSSAMTGVWTLWLSNASKTAFEMKFKKKHRNLRTDSYVKKLIILLTYCLLFVSLINTHV